MEYFCTTCSKAEGRIEGAMKFGNTWMIPADAKLDSLPQPSRSGYGFLGWYDATEDGMEKSVY